MKRLLILLLLALPQLPRAQTLLQFYDKCASEERFASVSLERKMMRMMSKQAGESGDKALAELLDGIESIRVLALREGDGEAFAAEAEALLEKQKYQLLTASTEEGQTTKFYLKDTLPGDYSSFVMLTCGGRETVWLHVFGIFDVRDVARLSSIRPRRTEK